MYQTPKLFKELNILNLKSLYFKNVCLLMYNVEDGIAVPSHSNYKCYYTSLESKSNAIVLKMRTVFEQQCPKYKFI